MNFPTPSAFISFIGLLALSQETGAAPNVYVDAPGDFDPANPTIGQTVLWKSGAPEEKEVVYGTDGFGSVQEAVDAIDPGGTVFLAPGVYDEGSEITIDRDLVLSGSGAKTTFLSGGGIHRVLSLGGQGAASQSIEIKNLAIIDGATQEDGAGIFTIADLELREVALSGNSTGGSGGAVYSEGSLLVINSTLSGNSAGGNGGGVVAMGGLNMRTSTVSGNSATNGGGIYMAGTGSLNNSTVAENQASNAGGGASGASMNINNSVVVGNSAVVASTEELDVPSIATVSGLPVGLPEGLSLSDLLYPLADNGGQTLTHLPNPSGPLVNGGFTLSPPPSSGAIMQSLDQRGYYRILGGVIDLGAVESATGGYFESGLSIYANAPYGMDGLELQVSTDGDFPSTVTTYAGNGNDGQLEGPKLDAELSYPVGLAEDVGGNIFIADSGNNVIRMIGIDGEVSTIAGSGDFGFRDGFGTSAEFAIPSGIAVDLNGDVYVADTLNHRIRKLLRPVVIGAQWEVVTVAGSTVPDLVDGGLGVSRLNLPHGLTISAGGDIYIADRGNHAIRRLVPSSNELFTVSGLGTAGDFDGGVALATFSNPTAVAVNSVGDVFVADSGNHRIRRISGDDVSTLAGSVSGFEDGVGAAALFSNPSGLAVSSRNTLVVVDESNHSIREVSESGEVVTLAGNGLPGFSDGANESAQFHCPLSLAILSDQSVLISDSINQRLRRIEIDYFTIPASSTSRGYTSLVGLVNLPDLGLLPDTDYYFRWRDPAGVSSGEVYSFNFSVPRCRFVDWQLEKFGANFDIDPIAEESADPDGDGVLNLLEFAFGADPWSPSAVELPDAVLDGSTLKLVYSEKIAAEDLSYQVQWSSDLINWSSAGVSQVVLSDNGFSRQIEASVEAGVDVQKFLRLQISTF